MVSADNNSCLERQLTVNEHIITAFDLSVYGHHPHYILHLCKGWAKRQPTGKLYFVVSPEFMTIHTDVVEQCSHLPSIKFVAISTSEYTSLKSRRYSGLNRNLRNFQEWQLFTKYAKQLRANHALMLYLDTCLLPIALGSPFPCPFSGIYFRPTFHYHTFSPRPQTYQDRLQSWRDRLILNQSLRHPRFSTLFSLDPIAPQHISPPNSHVRVLPLADPVDVSYHVATANNELRQHLGIEDDRTVFLLFGALNERKGIYQLLQSLKILPNELCQKICLVLLGKTNSQEHQRIEDLVTSLRQQKNLQILERYEFVEEEILHQYIAMSDVVLALYQRHVGMSGVLMQAALHKKPVLSSDYGLMGEWTRRHHLGITIDSTSPQEIAKGMTLFLEKSPEAFCDYAKMHTFAKQNSAENFAQTVFQNL